MVLRAALGEPQFMLSRRITRSGLEASVRARQAPLYVLGTSLMVGAIMFSAAPGVGWGMFLIGCALVVAARNASATGRTRGTQGAARSAAEARR